MNQPSLDLLMEEVDSRYSLVVIAAKRARMITEGEKPKVEVKTNKPVTYALHEIGSGQIKYKRLSDNLVK